MIDDNLVKHFKLADWNDITLRLTLHAKDRAYRYNWYSGNPSILPGGKTVEDIACEAIEKVLRGKRKWDPKKYPDLLKHLKIIVNSDLSHLFQSKLNRKTTRSEPWTNGEKNVVNDSISTKSVLNNTEKSNELKNPEDALLSLERKVLEDKLRDALYESVSGDDELESILLCFEEGIDKPQKLAEELNWKISKVNNLKRKLFRKAKKVGQTIVKKEFV
ncbi:hypothetical protein QUF75_13960 [Desulfococcaceae bacterium HSG7]|nr:hypothetical protein [Desulfococcaceae bacterium HSG7]